ncbi:hypothetical protein QBC33DRAFT_458779 [Phialemonium atrogriseum]|uniref:SET domain-containing protein n=1 Tax=Phialemonium atrogriseum TaxID=1093897 RepID=A0AAJ0BUP9_9PEZI|nr:uncharacterized protein QBC33DRAFT_458779 [Phialemonium atrogriseum]KAK1763728.1 hypothetical protein QBC33DRAFT_458779 [Phialemonium atrogriseum]
MARATRPSYLAIAATICTLLTHGALSKTTGDPIQVQPPAGQGDGLAYDTTIAGLDAFASNLTAGIEFAQAAGGGWYDPKLCSGGYCVYGNRQAANGRGVAVVTTGTNMQRIKRMEPIMGRRENNGPTAAGDPGFEERDVPGRGVVLVANRTLRRGDTLMAWTPVLFVHKSLYKDLSEDEQGRLLAAAVHLLPDATRDRFKRMMLTANAGGGKRDLREVVKRLSFETNMAYRFAPSDMDNEKHYVTYPEVVSLAHDCRGNVAYYIDGAHTHHSTVARKVAPGEELTMSYVDPFMPRAQRQEWVDKWKKTGCSCAHCTAGGDLGALARSDERLAEIQSIEAVLKEPDSKGVTTDMLARLVELYKEERLEPRMSDMYELVAINYNNLGYAKRATKYALLAAQAGAVERGADANDIVAMRILAKDPEGHYSWRTRVPKSKGKGNKVAGK